MGGMFTMVKVRDDLPKGQFSDPGWFKPPAEQVARAVTRDLRHRYVGLSRSA